MLKLVVKYTYAAHPFNVYVWETLVQLSVVNEEGTPCTKFPINTNFGMYFTVVGKSPVIRDVTSLKQS